MRRIQRALLLSFTFLGLCVPLHAQSARPVYLYVASRATQGTQQGLLNAYRVDVTTGALSPVAGSPFPAGTDPNFVTVDPSGRFIYVNNFNSNNISAYQVDAVTGSLTPLPGSPFLTGRSPGSIKIDPTGRYLYVGSVLSADVSVYSIDSVTGVLMPIVGSPFAFGTYASAISFDLGGNHVYFGQSNAGLLVDTLNLQNGTFKNVQTIAADQNVYSMSFSPNGKFAFTVKLTPILCEPIQWTRLRDS